MKQTLNAGNSRKPSAPGARIRCACAVFVVATITSANLASSQTMPGSRYGMPGRPSTTDPGGEEIRTSAPTVKPDVAAGKALAAGLKSLNQAKQTEAAAALLTNSDQRGATLEKARDLYMVALAEFTESLTNQNDLAAAWDGAGYAHLRLGAYGEAADEYTHALALKPDLWEAIEHRGEAYLSTDHLDDVESAYSSLADTAPELGAQLLSLMQKWVTDHRANPHGVKTSDIDAVDKWVLGRSPISKPTASLTK